MSRTIQLQVLTAAAAAAIGCAADPDELGDERESESAPQALSGAARRPRSERIRDVAAQRGLTNGVLLAGIAQVETGLSHCWSEATWACQGPYSSFCGGPVIAGASDGPCSAQQGGLGMFQFDAGTYAQTLARDGQGILQLDGNIDRAVDFLIRIVREEIAGVDSAAEALAWMSSISVTSGNARFNEWNALLACRYNGRCGSASQAAKYRDATLALRDEFGAGFWRVSKATAGDVNGDGRADLVSLHTNGNTYTWLGAASGGLGGAVAAGQQTFDSALVDSTGHLVVGVADVNGDHRADLVTVHSGGSAYVYLGTSSGAWGARVESFAGTMALATLNAGAGHDPIAVADVNGDGRADLVTHHSDGNVYVYLGTSGGAFQGRVASGNGTFDSALRDGRGHWFVGAADVNGDGRADLVSVTHDGTAWVYLGTTSGAFATRVASFDGTLKLATVDGVGHLPIGLGDVNGDGRADLVTHHTNQNVYTYLGAASGAFSGRADSFNHTMAMAQFGGPGHQVIGLLDITGDGKADLVTIASGHAHVYFGAASGAFSGSAASFNGTLDSSFADDTGHELVQMGPFSRRRPCPTSGCRVR